MLRDHGQAKKYYHDMEGYNGRLDAIQAALLRIKLQHLASWNEQRRRRAETYAELLSGAKISAILPAAASWAKPVYHLYVIRVEDRDGLMFKLTAHDIGTGIHYPFPLHLQSAYCHLGYSEGDFPVSERLAREIVSLPMFPTLTADEQARVCDTITEVLSSPVLVP